MKKRFHYSAVLILLFVVTAGCATSSGQGLEQEQTEILPGEPSAITEPEPTSKPTTGPIKVIPTEGPVQPFASEYCQEGQELLYYEDFEDENAAGWYNIEDTDWSYETIEGRGTALKISMPKGMVDIFYLEEFENAVWLLDLQVGNLPVHLDLKWHYQKLDNGKKFYYAIYNHGDYLQIHVADPEFGEAQSGLTESEDQLPPREPGDWQRFAFAYFDGRVDVFLDGAFIAGEQHTNPIESGGFGFWFGDYPESISIDNVAVCSLVGQYEPQ
jgi:hypothetical protein